jgi:hypothetical protein
MNMTLTEAEAAELARWRHGKLSIPEWLATNPTWDSVHASLVRALDRRGQGGVFARVLADHLRVDADNVYAENYPRKAAQLAADLRADGNTRRSDWIRESLVQLMFCANCGRPLGDPVSIDRGIGPDCWERIDPAWRASIEDRLVTTTQRDSPW